MWKIVIPIQFFVALVHLVSIRCDEVFIKIKLLTHSQLESICKKYFAFSNASIRTD